MIDIINLLKITLIRKTCRRFYNGFVLEDGKLALSKIGKQKSIAAKVHRKVSNQRTGRGSSRSL
jgi:hypothetical protein